MVSALTRAFATVRALCPSAHSLIACLRIWIDVFRTLGLPPSHMAHPTMQARGSQHLQGMPVRLGNQLVAGRCLVLAMEDRHDFVRHTLRYDLGDHPVLFGRQADNPPLSPPIT